MLDSVGRSGEFMSDKARQKFFYLKDGWKDPCVKVLTLIRSQYSMTMARIIKGWKRNFSTFRGRIKPMIGVQRRLTGGTLSGWGEGQSGISSVRLSAMAK
jgi:hypothetical protein